MIRWLDYPPIWLAGFVLVVWALARALPGMTVTFFAQTTLALLFFFGGALLMGLAVWEMGRARTTVIPHRDPQALVRSGIFRLSRNPIYLGDAMVLMSATLWTGMVIALPLVWAFKRVIEARFILPEEARLKRAFGEGFADWANVTRRWV